MSLNQIQLSGKAILEKDFKTAMRGYNQEEVDEFLDAIIQDYDIFTQEVERLTQEKEQLQQEIDRLKKTTTEHSTLKRAPQPPTQVNYDVLKRLSNLEKAVFGNKQAEADS